MNRVMSRNHAALAREELWPNIRRLSSFPWSSLLKLDLHPCLTNCSIIERWPIVAGARHASSPLLQRTFLVSRELLWSFWWGEARKEGGGERNGRRGEKEGDGKGREGGGEELGKGREGGLRVGKVRERGGRCRKRRDRRKEEGLGKEGKDWEAEERRGRGGENKGRRGEGWKGDDTESMSCSRMRIKCWSA